MCLCTIYYVIIPLVAHLNLVRQSLSSPSQGRSLLLLSVFKGLSHYFGRYILIIRYIFFFCSIVENLLVQTSVLLVFAMNRKSTHHIPLSSTKDKTFIVISTCFKSTSCQMAHQFLEQYANNLPPLLKGQFHQILDCILGSVKLNQYILQDLFCCFLNFIQFLVLKYLKICFTPASLKTLPNYANYPEKTQVPPQSL